MSFAAKMLPSHGAPSLHLPQGTLDSRHLPSNTSFTGKPLSTSLTGKPLSTSFAGKPLSPTSHPRSLSLSRRLPRTSCHRAWHSFITRRHKPTPNPKPGDNVPEGSSPQGTSPQNSASPRPRRIVASDRRFAGATIERGAGESQRAQGKGSEGPSNNQAPQRPSWRWWSHWKTAMWRRVFSLLKRLDVLSPAKGTGQQNWTVPWKGDTIFQVMFLWFMAFWFIGSWLIPVLTQLAGLSRSAMSLRAQALYSLSTDLAEMAVGLSILNRCLSRFGPLPEGWFQFKLRGKWYSDALFACALFPIVQLLSRVNTYLLPVSLKFPPALPLEQSISCQDPIATLIYATTVVSCAPIWEEVVFRGFLLPSLTRYLPLWGSILASAAVFSLAHFSLQRLLPLFFLGIVLGVVFARSQNLVSSILLHSLWNTFVFMDLLL